MLQLVCPEEVLGKGCTVNILNVLTEVYVHVSLIMIFLIQTTFFGSLLSLFVHSCIKVH